MAFCVLNLSEYLRKWRIEHAEQPAFETENDLNVSVMSARTAESQNKFKLEIEHFLQKIENYIRKEIKLIANKPDLQHLFKFAYQLLK